MAAQGLRDWGDGRERIADPKQVEELRARGRFINRVVVLSTVVATGLIFLARAI
jgi:hypothetical protein